MGKIVDQSRFEVKSKEDLYTVVLVKAGEYYHGCNQYAHHTPFGLCKSIDEFIDYLDMLSIKEIIDYRDDFDGSILHDMVDCNLSIQYFDEILNRIGKNNFINLLNIKDGSDNYPISNAGNLELFKHLISFTGLNEDSLKKITCYCSNSILNYLTEIINDRIFN